MVLHDKILELKRKSAPINYRDLGVNDEGALVTSFKTNLDKRIVEGYTVIWGHRNLHREIFIRGAFAKSIRENGPGSNSNYEIKFLYNHNTDEPLSLFEELKEDEIGLYFRTKPLDDVQIADDTLKRLRSGTLNNYSQGFDYVWDEGKIAYDEKTDSLIIKEAILYEVSVATIPSGMETYTIRSAANIEALDSDVDQFIKSLPRKHQLEARQIFARHKSLINLEPLDNKKNTQDKKPVTRRINYGALKNDVKSKLKF